MSRQIAFDWNFDEEAFERRLGVRAAEEGANTLPRGERALLVLTVRALVAFVFVIVTAGGAPYSLEQLDRRRTASELTAILDLDKAAWREGDRDRYDMLIDPDVDREWVGEWRDNWGAKSISDSEYDLSLGPLELLGDGLVQAEVYVTPVRTGWWQPPTTRETRFYRSVDGLWLRTLPPQAYWGEQRTLETEMFVFDYFAADEHSVRLAAERLNDTYADLFRTMGLGPIPSNQRISVSVKPGLVHTWSWSYSGLNVHELNRPRSPVLEVTSPKLSPVPSDLSNGDYLTERVLLRVTTALLRDRRYVRMRYDWSFVSIVLRGWLVEELLDHPNAWRQDAAAVFRKYGAGEHPLQLTDVDSFLAGGQSGRETVLWRYEAASSVLDYTVDRYGQEAIPMLIEAFGEYGSWPRLTEEVFETSVEEFTRGWNEYVSAEYGF